MNILVGVSGSIAATLTSKLVDKLKEDGHNVYVVVTKSAENFITVPDWKDIQLFTDESEWVLYRAEKKVLHILLRDWADLLLIAPCTANTWAKMNVGLCDNLLTNVFMAWPYTKPIVIAPAMNTVMWENLEEGRLTKLTNCHILPTQTKELFCGQVGAGAMADINEIAECVNKQFHWKFPVKTGVGQRFIPTNDHPGAFGYKRKHYYHSGVDIYTAKDNELVYAVESGQVIKVSPFTGPKAGSPWWEDTTGILVDGLSGVVCYGEVRPFVKTGDTVYKGQAIARVKRVLIDLPEHPPIYHSPYMLHLELYEKGTTDFLEWMDERPKGLLDPTNHLLQSI